VSAIEWELQGVIELRPSDSAPLSPLTSHLVVERDPVQDPPGIRSLSTGDEQDAVHECLYCPVFLMPVEWKGHRLVLASDDQLIGPAKITGSRSLLTVSPMPNSNTTSFQYLSGIA
jgi:hypothetical protein